MTQNTCKESWEDLEDAIEDYYNNHPQKYYLKFPEFAVSKLKLNKNLLNSLDKDINKRTREDIREWMINSNMTFDELIYVGW